MTGTLVVEPFGGLGNRMRVLVSAINLSQQLRKELKVIWRLGPDLNCPYELLYQPSTLFQLIPDYKLKVYSTFNKSKVKRFVIKALNSARGYNLVIWEHDHEHTFFSKEFDVRQLSHYENIYIRSCEQFFGGNHWDIFQPVQALSIKIEDISKCFAQNTIGIHIRRKDNSKSTQVSTLDSFVRMMHTELIANQSSRFFISSDDETTVDTLRREFSSQQIITAASHFSRDSQQGIQDAVIDMHCLSRCNKIFGSYWSSFSEVASFLRGTELEIAK